MINYNRSQVPDKGKKGGKPREGGIANHPIFNYSSHIPYDPGRRAYPL
jgi:hypothetical protein